MRKLVLGVLSAAALGLMIAPAATAAPADGLAIKRGRERRDAARRCPLVSDPALGCWWRRRCWR